MRQLTLLLLLLSLTACGRGASDIYRAYNISPVRDENGKVAADLAAQNRLSMQVGVVNNYFYEPPSHETVTDSEAEEADETDNSDEMLPDTENDAEASEDSEENEEVSDEQEPVTELEDKIDALADALAELTP